MPDQPPPDQLLNRPLLRELAGQEACALGEQIFAAGRVQQLHTWPDRASAKVEDAPTRRVKLWRARGELQWACTCPTGGAANPCEHTVALGLAWLANSASTVGGKSSSASSARQEREAQRQRIAEHLAGVDPDRLAALLLEATDYDDILRRRLLLESIGVARPKGGKRRGRGAAAPRPDLTAYREILRDAIEVGDYVDYEAMPDYAQGVEEAVAPLDGLLHSGHAPAVIELAEFALVALDAAAEWLDGSDGSLNRVYDELQRLHHEACRTARPDPETLAARLLAYELEGGLGVFSNAANNYAEVLGEHGVREWRKLVAERWDDLTAASPTATGIRPIDHRRYQLQALMESIATADGDVDRLVEIKSRDLSSPHDFLSLAQLCQAAGRDTEAADWAERGLRAFPEEGEHAGLRDFVAGRPGGSRPPGAMGAPAA